VDGLRVRGGADAVSAQLKVVSIHDSNYRDTVTTLRLIADQIEAGKYGAVGCCGIVLLGDKLEVFGMGPDSDGAAVQTVLSAGAYQLMKEVAEHGL